jgi:hypothetical protein
VTTRPISIVWFAKLDFSPAVPIRVDKIKSTRRQVFIGLIE